ncbi:MAG: sulfotransferase [Myxococcota bacterium]|nr:sulfotransferase [Myxococcota bacterium]
MKAGFLASEAEFHAAAREACGLEDFGDGEYREGLRALLESLDRDAALNPVGHLTLRGSIVEALVGRLLSEDGWARHPECTAAPVEQPLVILGLPRTGTSALQQLLAQDPALQGLEYWLSITPKARPPRNTWAEDPEFRSCDERLRLLYEQSPGMKAIHFMQAGAVDECWRLLSQSFAHSSWHAWANVAHYEHWWSRHDMRPAYQRHRKNLQLIGHREPEKRWLLKDSTHLFDLDAFLSVYPDARVIQTHRDPVRAIASVCSLCWAARQPLNENPDPAAFGRATLDLWERAVLGAVAARTKHDPAQFFDLPFGAFQSDPLAAIEAIYAHFGIAYSEAAETAMRRFRTENPRDKHGAHHYDVETWGLDPDEIRERFQAYVEAFDVPSESR